MSDDVPLKEFIQDHLSELEASINRRFTALEQMVHAGVLAHQREHLQIDTQKARDEADVNRRLDAMNELRAQINTERGLYITRPLLDSQLSALDDRINELAGRLESQARFQSNLEGRFWMFGAGLTALSVLINLALNVLRH